MNNKISCFCLLLLWAATGYQGLFAQAAAQFPTDRFERVLAGKIKGSVNAFLQTKNGFIWFGTARGLYRYDGYAVKKYISSPNDTNRLSSNAVNGLAESKNGKIWISTWGGGLNLFDPATETFQSFRHNPQDKSSLKTDILRGVAEDPQGRVYVLNDFGFDLFDPVKRKFKHFTSAKSFPGDSFAVTPIHCIFFDRRNRTWITDYNGLYLFNPGKGTFTSYKRRLKVPGPFLAEVKNIKEDSKGQLWVSTFFSIDQFDPNTGQFKNYYNITPKIAPSTPQLWRAIEGIQIDANDRIWFGSTYGKIFCLNPNEIQPGGDMHAALKAYSIGIYQVQLSPLDQQGNSWVLDDKSNLYRFSTNNPTFQLYTPFSEEERKRLDHIIDELHPYDSGKKIMVFSSSNPANLSYLFDTQSQTFTNGSSHLNPYSLLDSNYTLEYIAKDGATFIADYPTCLRLFKSYLQKQSHKGKKTDQYRLIAPYSLHEAVLMEADQDTFQILRHNPNDPHSLSEGNIFNIYRDSKGITWVCTSGGLNRFDYTSKKFQRFVWDRNNPKSISHNAVGTILEDSKGTYWVGTYNGLEHFDPKTGHFNLVFGKSDETGMIDAILEDKHGIFWLYCASGLVQYNPTTKQGRIYDENDGLIGIKGMTNMSFRKLPTGEIVAGGNKGYFILFHPDSIRQNAFIPPVYITNLSYYQGDKQIFVPGISPQKTLTVSYRENPIMVEFAALNYIDPEKNHYAYKLEGIHQDWIPLGSRRELIFTDLRPGHYTLRIKGSNNDGVWNEVGTTLYLTITPPWWQSTWFYVLLSALILGLAYTFYRYRLGQIRQQAEYKQRLAEIETQALRAQMNPHFIFNAIHSMKRFLLSNDVDSAEAYMSRFARLMRLILENSQTTLVSLQSELELLDNYIQIEQLRFGHKFDYQIQIAEELDVEEIMLPSLIIQPYAENAIIHGLSHKRTGKGLLSIKVAGQEDALEITIEDNGIGRKQSKEIEAKRRDATPRKSAGMNITQKRLAIFEQNTCTKTAIEITDLQDEAGQAAGTRVDILIAYR